MRSPLRARHLLCAFFVLFATLFVAPTTAYAQDSATTIAKVKKSLVLVDVTWSAIVSVPNPKGELFIGRPSFKASCTGWFVREDGYIVTAGHCVDKEDAKDSLIYNYVSELLMKHPEIERLNRLTADITRQELRLTVSQTGSNDEKFIDSSLDAQLIDAQSPEHGDLALLRVPYITGAPVLPVAKATPAVGTEVQAIGYPGTFKDPSFEQSQLMPQVSNGQVSSLQNYKGTPVIGVTAQLFGGMSGGPVVNTNGEVIGISSFVFDGLDFITDTKALREFLSSRGVEATSFVPPSPPATVSKERPDSLDYKALITILSVLLVISISASIFLAIQLRRARRITQPVSGRIALPAGSSPAASS